MSGTSLDGVDIALCEIDDSQCKLIASLEYPFDRDLKENILNIISGTTTLEEIGTLHSRLGNLFADAINEFIRAEKIETANISAVGLHGQTLWHKPNGTYPFSMQLGCPNIVSAKTDIKVVADFRSMDIANGGQGAPFAPAFHKEIFASLEKKVAILNIGGMANITILDGKLRGWDTGCGNVLMDLWISQCKNIAYDKNGEVARSGKVNSELLNSMLQDDYFKQLPPKSTGREYFNETWLANYLPLFQTIKDEDIQRTLLELTAQTIANDVKDTQTNLLIVCGGGVKNTFLMERLEALCEIEVASSDIYGVSSEFMESMAFAWLAYKRIHSQKVELSSVTGASRDSILGGIYG
jgi:anhydro-N-acetylmuramic acid kinase